MRNQTDTTRPVSVPRVNIDAVTARLTELAAVFPGSEPAVAVLAADIAQLWAEVARLSGAVLRARLQSANRLAAIRAALRAQAEGEPDPLGFLWDELADAIDATSGQLSGTGTGRGWCR